ncbi:hypothetical protein SDC9_80849 [bioreactor metagenome]|uniref:Uncharacterized protein n=1 Tax=bioreactor metagenome TaxID=1076179 RepID=A0A644Z0W3_9ZZZZ
MTSAFPEASAVATATFALATATPAEAEKIYACAMEENLPLTISVTLSVIWSRKLEYVFSVEFCLDVTLSAPVSAMTAPLEREASCVLLSHAMEAEIFIEKPPMLAFAMIA